MCLPNHPHLVPGNVMELRSASDGLDLAEEFLRLSLTGQVTIKSCLSPAAAGISRKRRWNEEEDEETVLLLKIKRVKQGSDKPHLVTNKSCVSPAAARITRKRRRNEGEDEESVLVLKIRKVKKGGENAGSITNSQQVVGNARDSKLSVGLDALSYKFNSSSQ